MVFLWNCYFRDHPTRILSQNNLSGNIPDAISNLPSLINLYVVHLLVMLLSIEKYVLFNEYMTENVSHWYALFYSSLRSIWIQNFMVWELARLCMNALVFFFFWQPSIFVVDSQLAFNYLSGRVPDRLYQIPKYKYGWIIFLILYFNCAELQMMMKRANVVKLFSCLSIL